MSTFDTPSIDRRGLLFGGAALAGAAGLTAGAPQAAQAQFAPPPYTMAERDRRWANVRAMMAEQNIDVLVVPANPMEAGLPTLGFADYLTNAVRFMGVGMVIFPAEGEPAVTNMLTLPMAPSWISDVDSTNPPVGPTIVEKVTGYGAASGRIGVIGTKAQPSFGYNEFTDHGTMLFSVWAHVLDNLPEAEFVDVSEAFAELMLVKGEEEIAATEAAAAKGEEFHQFLLENLKPGVTPVQAREMIAAWFPRNGATTAVEVLQFPFPPGPIGEGTVINTEYDVFYQGGRVQITLCMAFGGVSEETQSLIDVAEGAMQLGMELTKPGVTFGEVVGPMQQLIDDAGYWNGFPVIHSLSPIVLVGRTNGMPPPASAYDAVWGADIELKPGMVLSYEPNARSGMMSQAKVGGTGVVTEDGVRMLNTIGNTVHVIA